MCLFEYTCICCLYASSSSSACILITCDDVQCMPISNQRDFDTTASIRMPPPGQSWT